MIEYSDHVIFYTKIGIRRCDVNFKVNDKNKDLLKIFAGGVVIIVLCLLVCLVHIIDIRVTYRERALKEFNNYLEIASQVIGNELEQTQLVVLSAKESIENSEKVLNDTNIFDLLMKYGALSSFYKFEFINMSKVAFYSNRTSEKIDENKFYESIYLLEKNKVHISENIQDTEGNPLMVFATPCFRDGEKVGILIAYQKTDGILDASSFDYLNGLGSTFIIDREGEILTKSASVAVEFQENKNIYDNIFDYAAEDDANALTVAELKQVLGYRESYSTEVIDNDRNTLVMAFHNVESVEDIYLSCFFNENIIEEQTLPVVFRSVLVCLIIILLMIIVAIIIWIFLNRTRRTIESLAYRDPVTGGCNSNYFIDKAMEILVDNKEKTYIIQRMDIANFRYLNEAYGHRRADQLLKICNDCAWDFFGSEDLFARMNSDQFVSLNECDASLDRRRIQYWEAVNQQARNIGIKYPIRIKFGVYQVRSNDLDLDVMIDRANVARRSMNGTETNPVTYFSTSLIQNMHKVDRIQSEMATALETGEFQVYLQAKWNTLENKLSGAEALVRWIKADGTVVYPDDFIPVFERNGFIEKLDFYMLETVCKLIQEQIKLGYDMVPISVNQSRILLHNPEYVQNVCNILKRYQIPKGIIELEITESLFFDEKEKMISIINELKNHDINISMDDFGSGYSSLNLLKDIPFDVLKIDRLFFSESITSESSTWILRKIVEMAEGLGINVVCEGVETKEQVEALQHIGCNYVQGYYYSRPISAKAFFEKYFEEENEEELSGCVG